MRGRPGGAAGARASDFEVTLFGRTISLDDVGLPLFTVAMGLLDGLNPCSMWVLILMISLLAPLNDRKRMLAIAGTFVLVEGIAYFVFMAAWLNLFLFIGLSRASELVIAGHRHRRGPDQSQGLLARSAGASRCRSRTAPSRASTRGCGRSCTRRT